MLVALSKIQTFVFSWTHLMLSYILRHFMVGNVQINMKCMKYFESLNFFACPVYYYY